MISRFTSKTLPSSQFQKVDDKLSRQILHGNGTENVYFRPQLVKKKISNFQVKRFCPKLLVPFIDYALGNRFLKLLNFYLTTR